MKNKALFFVGLISAAGIGGYFFVKHNSDGNGQIISKNDKIAVTADTSKPNSGRKVLIGFNANISNSPINYSDEAFRQAITKLHPQIIRWPGGSVSNSFNPLTGSADDGTGTPNKLEDLAVLVKEAKCDVMFVLNMVTHTLDENLQALKKAQSLGIPVLYVELGNEYNNMNSPGRTKYPTPTDYANECVKWIRAIKALFPDVEFGAIGENKGYKGGRTWNDDVLKILGSYKVHLITHEYPNPNDFSTNGIVDFNKLDAMVLNDLHIAGFDRQKDFWVTEYNIKYSDKKGVTASLLPEQHEAALVHLTKLLIEHGATILCVHNLTGKEGVFNTKKRTPEIMPTGIAMQRLLDSIQNK